MPVVSQAQAGLMGADLARAEKGESTRTGMSAPKLREYLRGAKKSELPERKEPRKPEGRKASR